MTEGRELAAVVDGRLDERMVERALEAAAASPSNERIRNAVETAIEIIEADPDAARDALSSLRGDPAALQRLEAGLGLSPERATLALGAAIKLAIAELNQPDPDLRQRTDELVRWLEGGW
jgi:hypothetical protein